ncbi:formylglycine-generating enzyme family protein [Pseudomonadota bacterium]
MRSFFYPHQHLNFDRVFASAGFLRCFALLLAFILAPQAVLAQEEVTVMLPGDVPLVLVKVPAGTFMMGSPPGERGNVFENETQHQVTLTQDYYLGKYEVTQAQWEAVMGTPMPMDCGGPSVGDDFPVYCVTWTEMAGPGGFMEKLNGHLGTTVFRLPTEAEWERAARAGTSTRFSHGDVLECGDDCEACAAHDPHMWFCGNVNPFAPKEVGLLQANPFGLHDMHGNLWELVNDLYTDDLGSDPVTDPTGPANNSNGDIVFRGGGAEVWLNRSASRLGGSPNIAENDETGFRVATSSVAGLAFQITNGLNDAWFNLATNGQGLLITVFGDIKTMFLAWFTYDTERPPEDVTAFLGEPGHRWLTAQGLYEGDTANLTIYMTEGGVFDSPTPVTETDLDGDGTMTIQFADCNAGLVTYHIESLDISGSFPIERLALDNVPLCETLSGQ